MYARVSAEEYLTSTMKEKAITTSDRSKWQVLPAWFYQRADVVEITKDLIGKVLVTTFNGVTTAGRIVEAEAYNGPHDKAAHSFNNRRTARTEIMFAKGGVAYVYLCYGIHQMFNIVTNDEGIPNAILIRAVEPLIGIETMLQRCGKNVHLFNLTKGPGNVAKALGIHTSYSGCSLQNSEIFVADDGFKVEDDVIMATRRIGVDYAAEDALLPYRFILKGNKYLSGKKRLNEP